ncbi:MAG TPA: nucleoside triphosphate pyrophosphohydrolase [Acidimicrobiales bacterium]|nr:nucleoside triphosphate pyrophosphohydrolase [Acidimicrobiales bacterium]
MTDRQGDGKLVRDLIPEVIRAAGGNPEASVLSEEAYRRALRAKLVEEVDELLAAGTLEGVEEELADAAEVLMALAALDSIEWGTVEARRVSKRTERGGFDGRVWLARRPDGT